MNSTLQFLTPVSRILWKEYRAQRGLWVALCVMGLLPQVMGRILAIDSGFRTSIIWSMVSMIPIFFAVGSTAILFAGEREERTSDWLQILAVPPLRMLMAKWAFVLLASCLLAMTLSFTAVILAGEMPRSDNPERGDAVILLCGIVSIFAGAILWGSLASLLSRRVVTAVPAMGFWWVVTYVLPLATLINYFRPQDLSATGLLLSIPVVFTLLATAWLGWQWCCGNYLDVRLLSHAAARVTDHWNRLLGITDPASRIPRRREFETTQRREWQRLVWQERRRDFLFRTLLCGGCALAFLLTVTGMTQRLMGIENFLASVLYICPFVMGIVGFRHEGEGQVQRFFAGRGISPGAIWLAKQSVWLPRAVLLPVVIGAVTVVADWLVPTNNHGLFPSIFQVTAPSTTFWLFLLIYGCGQLGSILFQRVILSIAAAGLLIYVAAIWLFLMTVLQVPQWWSVGGVVIWLFAMSWWMAPDWLLERRPALLPRRLAKFLALPVIILVSVGIWRATEIPGLDSFSSNKLTLLPQAHGIQGQGIIPVMTVQGRRVPMHPVHDVAGLRLQLDYQSQLQKAPVPSFHAAVIDAAMHVKLLPECYPPGMHRIDLDNPQGDEAQKAKRQFEQAARDEFWASNRSRLQIIMHAIQTRQEMDWILLDADQYRRLWMVLNEAGQASMADERLVDALQYDTANLKLCSCWARGGMEARQSADTHQLQTLFQVLFWANHRDQTVSSLDRGLEQVRDTLARYPTSRESLVAQYLHDRQQLESVVDHGVRDWLDRHDSERAKVAGSPRGPLAEFLRYLPWERSRAQNLLDQELVAADSLFQRVGQILDQPGIDVDRFYELWQPIYSGAGPARRQSTPLILPPTSDVDQQLRLSILQRETFIRESLLAIRLLIWKKEHGTWPEKLTDILPGSGLPVQTVIDPWSGEYFRYSANLDREPNSETGVSELLSSVGESRLREVICAVPDHGDDRTNSRGQHLGMRDWTGEKYSKPSDNRFRLGVNGSLDWLVLMPPAAWAPGRRR